jgi:PAS domain S-box-containing protein
VIISVLLWMLLWRAGAVHGRAVALADEMTRAFRDSEAQRERAEAFSLVMVTRIGLDGRWQSVPPSLAELLGRHPSRLLGAHCSEVMFAEDYERHWVQCERLLRGEIRSFDMEQRFIHADGRLLWLYVNWSIVTDADGTPIQFLAYLRDITDA